MLDNRPWLPIPEAGVLSEDAEGFGAVHALVVDGARQYVVGSGRQLYRRDGLGDWQRISANKSHANGYEAEHSGRAISVDGGLLVAGFELPSSERTVADLDPKRWENMSTEQFIAMMDDDQAKRSNRPRIERIYRYRDGDFAALPVPEESVVRGLYLDPDGRIWRSAPAG